MGKNQAYKAMQRSRVGSSSGGPEEVEDGMVDGSFHSPEWHAARLAGLKTSHTVTWEEYKRKQKEDAMKKGELEADTDRMMREYRAQLDAERACKLARGRNPSSRKSSKKDKKEKDLKKRSSSSSSSSRKRKHSRRRSSDSSTSSSSSESSSSDDEERESKRSKSKSKREKKKKYRSKSKNSNSDNQEDGPVPLSRFFESLKS